MKILYLAPLDLSRDDGPALHVRRLCEALQRRGHEVRLLGHRPSRHLVWSGPSGGLVLRGGPETCPVPRLRHLVSEWMISRTLRQEWRRFGPDLILVRQEAFTIAPWFAGLEGAARSVPLVVESNSSLQAVAASSGAPAARVARLAAWEERLLRAADAVGCVSEALSVHHREQYRLPEDRLFLVPNGAWVPPPLGGGAAELRHDGAVRDDEFLVGFAGNFNAVQGLELLLDLLARPDLPQLRGWIMGDAPERAVWRELASRLGARVSFLGALPEEEVDRRLQACQAVVAPYRAEDFSRCGLSSLKVLSALACDRPLLVSDAPGLESLRDLASVTLVGASDGQAWVAAIRSQVDSWEAAGRPLRDWPWLHGDGPGRRFIETRRTWDHTAAAWEAAFARAISGSRPRSR